MKFAETAIQQTYGSPKSASIHLPQAKNMINLFSYAGLPEGQLLKIKLKNEPAFIYGTIKELGPLQPANDGTDDETQATAATLQLIDDIDLYLSDPAAFNQYDDFQLLSTHIESIGIIDQ